MGLDAISAFGAVAEGLLRGDVLRRQMDRQDMLDKLQTDNAALKEAAAARKEQMDTMRMLLDATRVQTQRDRLGMEQERTGLRRDELDFNRGRLGATERERAANRFLAPLAPYEKDSELASATMEPRMELRGFTEASPEGVPGNPKYDPTEGYLLGNQRTASMRDVVTAAQPILAARNARKDRAADQKDRVSDQQAKEMVAIENSIEGNQRILDLLEKTTVDPNHYGMTLTAFLTKYGAGLGTNEKAILLAARGQRTLADYVKSISGAQVSDNEYARLAKVVYDPKDDSLKAALIKARDYDRWARRYRMTMMRVWKELQGKNLRGYDTRALDVSDTQDGSAGNALTDPETD